MHHNWIDRIVLSKSNLIKDESRKVSIIIPSHTNVKYARSAVESALNQTYKNIEILVMTDMPELGLEKELSGLLEKIKLFSQPNIKSIDKFNFLAEKATGEFIVFLCDDDLLDPRFIEKTLFFLDKKKVDIVCTDWKLFQNYDYYDYARKWNDRNFVITNPAHITALFKKDVWEKVGKFHDIVFFDWDFWWHAYKAGFKAYNLNVPLFSYRIHAGQDTNICNMPECTKLIRNMILKDLKEKR
jgi:glycosyltransferase involved in cell wall biosynthesis